MTSVDSRPLAAPPTAPLPAGWSWTALGLECVTLASGLTIVLAEQQAVPLLFLSWTSAAGLEAEPSGLEGIASLTPPLLREGTVHRDGARIARELDDLGAELVVGSDWDRAFLNIGLLSRDLAAGLDLLLDMACTPRIHEAALTRLRQGRLATLGAWQRDPRLRAQDALAHALFGDGLYGRPPLGSADSVQRIDADAVTSFHDASYRPTTSSLVIAGSFDRQAVMDLIATRALPKASPARGVPPTRARMSMPPQHGPRLVEQPQAAQTEICIGAATVARGSDDLPGLELLNEILGGGPASRLASRLRRREGLTYHVRSQLFARRLGGLLTIATGVAHDSAGAAVDAIHGELARLRDACVSATEIEQARRTLLVADLKLFQDLIGTGATLGGLALTGSPVVQLERRRQALQAITPEALRALARRYLASARIVTAIAGPAGALAAAAAADEIHRERETPLPTRS